MPVALPLTPKDLPATIPLFPLPGVLLLPRARLPLHIFEPRYLALLEDALKTPHRIIGMIQPQGGNTPGLSAIGCAGRVTAFSETDDGRYMITLVGLSRFRLLREVGGFTPYIRADVDWSPFVRDLGAAEDDPGLNRARFLDVLVRYFDANGLSTDYENLKGAADELLINSLSMLCPLNPGDRQALLEAPSLPARRETLVTLMEYALHSCGPEGEERMQ